MVRLLKISPVFFLLLLQLAAINLFAKPKSSVCSDRNLLTGIVPQVVGDVQRDLSQLTDGKGYANGALWDLPNAVIMGVNSALVFDLGRPTKVSGAWVQADNNDLYTLEGSLDGKTYTTLSLFNPVAQQGLYTRWVDDLKAAPVRYVRLSPSGGDNYYSVSETGLYCKTPQPFPPPMQILYSPPPPPPNSKWDGPINDYQVTVYKVVLTLFALALFGWGYSLQAKGRNDYRFFRMTALGIVALFSVAAYYNFFHWHFENDIHSWEVYHYYMGSKYFPELRYTKLYECTTVADSEEGLGKQIQGRRIRDHRTNQLRPATYILEDPSLCKSGFSEERWYEFKNDLKWFRGAMDSNRWGSMQQDHGYNPPPLWTTMGRMLSSVTPTTNEGIRSLIHLDIFIIFVMFGFIAWAFGLEGLLLALIVWGNCYPSRYYWIGGAFLRQSWLVSAMIGLCFLKKGKNLWGGFLLAVSTLITIFPLMFGVGYGIKILDQWIRTRKLVRPHLKFLIGYVVGGLILFLISIPGSGGGRTAYSEFFKNISVHMGTPLTNHMGLKTVMAYRPSTKAQMTIVNGRDDPFEVWKMERRKAFQQIKWLYAAIVLGFFFLFWKVTRDLQDWEAAALGFVFVPMLTELTCYYYSFVIAGAMLAVKRPRLGMSLLLATLAWLISEFYWDWFDVKYTYDALIAVLLCFYFVVFFLPLRLPRLVLQPASPSRDSSGKGA